MAGEGTVVRVSTVDLFDGQRGLMFHKGTFIEAPPEFFKRYDPVDMVQPKKPFNAKTDHKMVITEYIGKMQIEEKKPESNEGTGDADKKAAAMTGDNSVALKGKDVSKKLKKG